MDGQNKQPLYKGLVKLQESGLTDQDAKQLGMELLDKNDTEALGRGAQKLPSIKLNYFNVFGKQVVECDKQEFYRLRYLDEPKGFESSTNKKPLRYVQPPKTEPHAYFPLSVQWSDFIHDVSKPIIITEGEFKAAKACKEGFPTIGLGGVYSWRSYKLGIMFLDELEQFTWAKRKVYICFDSDYRTNPMVCKALSDFATQIHDRGGLAHMVSLPAGEDQKIGLDDYLVETENANAKFKDLLDKSQVLGITKPLLSYNDRYVFIQTPTLIVDMETNDKHAVTAWRDQIQANRKFLDRSLDKKGNFVTKETSAAAEWIKWPLRNQMHSMTYAPGEPKYTMCKRNGRKIPGFNTWPGWGVQPEEGDVSPFLNLIDHLFTEAEPEAKDWFLKWCAHPIKFPGTKMFTSSVFHGVRHGTGKSLVGYTLGRIYGANFTEISQMDLHNSFNEWAESKQFVMGDDVTGSNKRADADFLKKMITQKELRINVKFIPSYTVPDAINYFFTANHGDSFFLEDDDRRFFIHEILVGPLEEEFYKDYDMWMDSGGPEALFHYFLNMDTSDFNPSGPAFKTSAKERMIETVRSDLASWVRQLIVNPDFILRVGELRIKKDMFSSKELLALYDPTGSTGTTANGVTRELGRAGVAQVLQGKPVALKDGSQSRFFAIRNRNTWLKSTPKKIKEHLNGFLDNPHGEKKY